MTKRDYIRQVDGLDLPDGLYAKLHALPSKGRTRTRAARPYRRWATLAAALVLVVGLGLAGPAILRSLTPEGGDITRVEGIVYDGIDVPDMVLDIAKSYVLERLVFASEHSGVREFVDGQWREKDMGPLPVYDKWRIEGLAPCYEEQALGNHTVSIYRLDYRLHTTTPERVILAGPSEIDGEGWVLNTYPGSTYMVFVHEGGNMRYVFTTMINDSQPGNALFESDILGELEQILATPSLSETDLAVSRDNLTLLLSERRIVHNWSSWELVYASSGTLRTFGILRYASADGTANLHLGTVDNGKLERAGMDYALKGDEGAFTTWTGADGRLYILCTNQTAGLYIFDGSLLIQHKTVPPAAIPPDDPTPERTAEMLDPRVNADFWADHKATINGRGLDIYRRDVGTTGGGGETLVYQFHVPLDGVDGLQAYAQTIPDEELAKLLAAQFPEERKPEDTWELLYTTPGEGVTMGVLEYESMDKNDLRQGFLILGAFDNATAQPSGQIQLFGGTPFESREMLPYSASKSEAGDDYFLCIRQNTGATPSSVYYYPTLYHFDGRAVKQVPSSPNANLPAGMEDMFDSAKNEDFWQAHKIIIAPGGFEMFSRNSDWNSPGAESKLLWVYDTYVPLAYEFPDPRVMAEARNYFVGYYGDDMAGSSYYTIKSCELVPDYSIAFYGLDSSAYRVVLEEDEGELERYFFFDGDGELLNVAPPGWTSPWVNYEDRLRQMRIKGVPFGGIFSELDESIRATLEDTGETEDLSVTQPGMVTPWILKTYRSASLEVVTATASEDVLKQRLAEGHAFTRELYDRVSGVEYIHQVRPLDGTYATEGGLRLGDSIERAQKLFYVLSETGEESYNNGMDHLYITTENGVVTDIVSKASTRAMGEGIFY